MPKSGAVVSARQTQGQGPPAELLNAVQGQIEEMFHELGVQVKRMRQLQDQADELRTVIRQWAGDSDVGSNRELANRGGRC